MREQEATEEDLRGRGGKRLLCDIVADEPDVFFGRALGVLEKARRGEASTPVVQRGRSAWCKSRVVNPGPHPRSMACSGLRGPHSSRNACVAG